jgi:hypothetical protein
MTHVRKTVGSALERGRPNLGGTHNGERTGTLLLQFLLEPDVGLLGGG